MVKTTNYDTGAFLFTTCYWRRVNFQGFLKWRSFPADASDGCCWSTVVPTSTGGRSPEEVRSADSCPA